MLAKVFRLTSIAVLCSQVYLSALAGLVLCISSAVHTQIEPVGSCCVWNRAKEDLTSLTEGLDTRDCARCSDIPLWGGSYLPSKQAAAKFFMLADGASVPFDFPTTAQQMEAVRCQPAHLYSSKGHSVVTSQPSLPLLC